MDNKGTNATSSICPKGWRMPPNEGNNSYNNLIFTSYGLQEDNEANPAKMRSRPLDFTLAGNYLYDVGRVYNTDGYGYYWSSTVYSSYDAYNLDFNSSGVDPQNWYNKASGLSVRCMAR